MSSPTTPARSIARSAFSTPSTAQYGTSPQELTPRSRVKAMLAAIDDESDSASEAPPKAKGLQRIALAPVVGNVRRAEVQKKIEYESDNGGEEEEDDDDDGPIVPRGRLAAQLNGQSLKSSDSGSSNWEEDGNEDAYTRIKKQLLQKDAKKARETTSGSETDAVRFKTTNRASLSSHRKTSTSSSDHGFSQRNSPIRNRRSSPDLFVTPKIPSGRNQPPIGRPATNDGSDSDLPANPQTNSRFLELVARKRAEREANQAEEVQKKAEKAAKQQSFQKQLSRDASSESDEDGVAGRRLTQQARPTRKASKKALEEMNRETQRMSRNMQLAHQAKTKKKITKDSLFARFNFRTATVPNVEAPQNPGSSTAASSAPVSELEDNKDKESPPTSPAGPDDVMDVDKESTPLNAVVEHAKSKIDKLPSMHDMLTQPTLKLDKGKGKAVEETKLTSSPDSNSKRSKKTGFTQPPIKVRPQKPSLPKKSDLESDSDLEIMPNRKTKKPRMDVFDRLPAGKFQDARSLQTLRALAHLNSPEKQRHSKKATMSLTDMQTLLQRRARQQALEERAAKMEDLKSRGIIVQTAEERQQDQADVEDLLEKARREGEEIKQKEKRAAKREKIANGEVDDLPDTSDEDEDYQEEGEGDGPEIELSGSEEEYVEIADGADGLASDAEESPDEDEEDG
ncbi:hypothetical protein ABVK25_011347 [Lepraria finkii]|uniref:DNA replication checkpoint mediator MRC1 domain-containing protein n=1 Tax=Lepraria finkii TaxID=1340010 RepID=A0ABR4APY8_9LECA